MESTPRWHQRLQSFGKALLTLQEACSSTAGAPTSLERDGIVQRFEYTYELGWKVLKDYLEYLGYNELRGPTDVRQQAFKAAIIPDGIVWYQMQEGRNQSSHEYSSEKIDLLFTKITNDFLPALEQLQSALTHELFKHGNA